MDGRGGCCIARYAGGAYDVSKVDRIMLRFRPIAPKPVSAGAVTGAAAAESAEVCVKSGRGKRRYVRDGNPSGAKRCYNRKRKASPEEKSSSGGSVSGEETVVTLPLLPETPDLKESPTGGSSSDGSDLSCAEKEVQSLPIWLNCGNRTEINHHRAPSGTNRTVVMTPQPVRPVGSIVTVECLTDTWTVGDGLGRTDEERRLNLERDTCPGFITDGTNRVVWTNGAYKKMVWGGGGGGGGGGEVMVWLVMKEKKVEEGKLYPAFTCRVRVQYTCGKERGSLTLPCDVWRMDGGDFAWRLDVKAALCLGR